MQLALLTWKDCLFKAMHTQVHYTIAEKSTLFCGVRSFNVTLTTSLEFGDAQYNLSITKLHVFVRPLMSIFL